MRGFGGIKRSILIVFYCVKVIRTVFLFMLRFCFFEMMKIKIFPFETVWTWEHNPPPPPLSLIVKRLPITLKTGTKGGDFGLTGSVGDKP